MPVVDLFSQRNRVAEGKMTDVFIYDRLPEKLLNQIVHIWWDAIGPYYDHQGLGTSKPHNSYGWDHIHKTVAREHGVSRLAQANNSYQRCVTYLLKSPSLDAALDLIDASFCYIDQATRNFDFARRMNAGITLTADAAIEELNERFRRAGVGYRFEAGMLMRLDSELLHAEVVRPALAYLHHKGFEGPRAEFLKAHAHYRAGETKAAITEANNAFESALKAICEQRNWSYPERSPASVLLKVVRDNGLLPNYLDQSFDQLAATLKSGLPKVRGEEGGHGQGPEPRATPEYVAAYALHLAAAQILFLIEAHQATKPSSAAR